MAHFSGNPKTEWVSDPNFPDRDMILLENFSYTDSSGRVWLAPEGSNINGASIPRTLWSSVGSPYTDDYRRASVVHDVACQKDNITVDERKEADKMFYDACMTDGCSKSQASILYAGVRLGSHFPDNFFEFQNLNINPNYIILQPNLIEADNLYRLPGKKTDSEILIQSKFAIIYSKINNLGALPDFNTVDSIIESELS